MNIKLLDAYTLSDFDLDVAGSCSTSNFFKLSKIAIGLASSKKELKAIFDACPATISVIDKPDPWIIRYYTDNDMLDDLSVIDSISAETFKILLNAGVNISYYLTRTQIKELTPELATSIAVSDMATGDFDLSMFNNFKNEPWYDSWLVEFNSINKLKEI